MKIVIDIPEEIYNRATRGFLEGFDIRDLRYAIKNGKPLPKGHGDLIDISPYKGKVICSHLYSGVKKLIEVDSIEPIIEASSKEE